MIPILVLLFILGWGTRLLAQTPFYQGTTISILVGTKAGDAERSKLEIDPSSWEEIELFAKEAMTTPPDVVERMKKVLAM